MVRLLPAGLFGRLRVQMMLLLVGGILVVDVALVVGTIVVQERVVNRNLDLAATRIEQLPAGLPAATTLRLEAFGPSDLFLAYLGSDGRVLATTDPTSSSDTPAVEALLEQGALSRESPVEQDAPGGTPYALIEVPVPPSSSLRLEDDGVPTPVSAVVLGHPLSEMDRTLRTLVAIEVGAGLAAIAAAFLASRWFVSAGLRPLRRMGRTAEAIAGGRTGERMEVDEDDRELRDVAQAVNAAFDARQESEDRMRDFVADASHELRTPLASVRGWSDLYLEGGLDDWDGVDAAMRTIHSEAGRMEELVEDMLTLARYDAGPVDAATEPLGLGPVLSELAESAGRLHPDHTYVLDPPPAGLSVLADPTAVRRALLNLLVNAGRHTPTGTRVEVTVVEVVSVAGVQEVEVRISDDGPGLSETERATAFNRFWRSDRSRGRSAGSGGSGLGLPISRSILRAVRGDLRLEAAPSGGLAAVVVLRRVP